MSNDELNAIASKLAGPSDPYMPGNCLGCGKRIPRWINGKQTRPTQIFHSNACGQHYRRMHRDDRRASNRKKARAAQQLPVPISTTEGRWDIGECANCGHGIVRSYPDQQFCSPRCEDYVPLPPRSKDRNAPWYHVAGPVDYCEECGLAITPRPPHGYVTGYRGLDKVFRCLECHDARFPPRKAVLRKRPVKSKPAANDNGVIVAKPKKAA
jgi:hypothetical protein